MINRDRNKNPMPEQEVRTRIENFDEVALGYSENMAVTEAMRCLQCRKKPCVLGCPVNNDIPGFINAVSRGEFEEAYEILKETTSLPAVCGRVCPQESQCEGKCIHGKLGEPVAIGSLERFVADWYHENFEEKQAEIKKNGHKVAVLGSGPAGLSCAGDLAGRGYEVTIFDSYSRPGGVLSYGIPKFRLPKEVVDLEIEKLCSKGVRIIDNIIIGKEKTVEDLFKEGYEAVFIGTGAGVPSFMNIEGENLKGVLSASEYLEEVNSLAETDIINNAKHVVVIGGGNVAVDAARCALRMGALGVDILYRRTRKEMPAYQDEINEAFEEGINFRFLSNPVKIIGDTKGNVKGIECVEMELSEPDESGRRRPVPVPDSEFFTEADLVIMAIGTRTDTVIIDSTAGLLVNEIGGIYTDENAATLKKAVYAGGDAVTGPATVVRAMGAGKKAASSIDEYFKSQSDVIC